MKNKFKANGCTGVPELIFHKACNQHDRDYYDMVGRKLADKTFYSNMNKSIVECSEALESHEIELYELAAHAYYVGVRTLGWFFYYINRRYLKKKFDGV